MNESAFASLIENFCRTNPRLFVHPIKPYEDLCAKNGAITYRRGGSPFKVKIHDLYGAMHHFAGKRVDSNDIRGFRPTVFDSKAKPAGHSCHIGLLFSLLLSLDLAEHPEGKGRAGSPFSVFIKADPTHPACQVRDTGK